MKQNFVLNCNYPGCNNQSEQLYCSRHRNPCETCGIIPTEDSRCGLHPSIPKTKTSKSEHTYYEPELPPKKWQHKLYEIFLLCITVFLTTVIMVYGYSEFIATSPLSLREMVVFTLVLIVGIFLIFILTHFATGGFDVLFENKNKTSIWLNIYRFMLGSFCFMIVFSMGLFAINYLLGKDMLDPVELLDEYNRPVKYPVFILLITTTIMTLCWLYVFGDSVIDSLINIVNRLRRKD